MDLALEKSLLELKSALVNDPRAKRLASLEKKLCEDPTLLELVKRKDDIERQYDLLLSYEKKDSEKAKAIEKQLYEAKMDMDLHPLAKEYNEVFIEIRDLYMHIDDIIFGPFRKKTLSSKAK